MAEKTCTFSYIAAKDCAPKTATGVERGWLDLKIEFGRTGEGLAGATYYKTISDQGPQLFAVQLDESVWYHDAGAWHRYQTATDIKYGKIFANGSVDDDDLSVPVSEEPSTPDDFVHVPSNFQH